MVRKVVRPAISSVLKVEPLFESSKKLSNLLVIELFVILLRKVLENHRGVSTPVLEPLILIYLLSVD